MRLRVWVYKTDGEKRGKKRHNLREKGFAVIVMLVVVVVVRVKAFLKI